MLELGRDAETDESFGLRHVLSPGMVPEIQEEDIRAGGGPGTSETDDQGDLRGLWPRDSGDGDSGGAHSPAAIVSAIAIDWGSGENHKESKREGAVSRVPGTEEKAMGRGIVGGRIFRPNSGRPNDSGCD